MKHLKNFCALFLCALIISASLCGCLTDSLKNDIEIDYDDFSDFSSIKKKEDKIKWVAKKMENDLKAGKTEIEFSFDCSEYVFDAYKRVYYENSEIFWIEKSSAYDKVSSGAGVTILFRPEIRLGNAKIKAMQKEIEAIADTVVSGIGSDATDYEKAIYIHDYIVDNTEYDLESAEKIAEAEKSEGSLDEDAFMTTNLYGCLVNKKAVCSGYSAAYKYLADKLGLECQRVNGRDKEQNIGHQWNMVNIEGGHYYVDATWDDAINTESENQQKTYEYFLITEEELLLTHLIDEGQDLPEASAESYNYYIVNGLYLESYTRQAFEEIFKKNTDKKTLSVKFSSSAEQEKAYKDLFKGKQEFWEILDRAGLSADTVNTSISESGRIINIYY